MRRILTVLAIATLSLSSMLATPPARAQGIGELMGEIIRLKAAQDDIIKKRDESIALKRENEAKLATLDNENNRLKSEGSAIDVQRPQIESLCNGTVPQSEYAAAVARCNSVLVPFNYRVKRYNDAVEDWRRRYNAVVKSEHDRAAAAQKLFDDYNRNAQQIERIRRIILVIAPGQCVIDRHCGDPNMDPTTAAACLMSCWDGSTMRSASAGAPPFSPAPASAPAADIAKPVATAVPADLKPVGRAARKLSRRR